MPKVKTVKKRARNNPLAYKLKGGSSFKARETRVPNSCIESAEFIIQVLASPASKEITWQGNMPDGGTPNEPNVWAEFGNRILNISCTEFANRIPTTTTNYNFGNTLPDLGEGICLIKKGSFSNKGYNMHFCATVKKNSGDIMISDISEPNSVSRQGRLIQLKTKRITDVSQFRSGGYESSDVFIMGKLTTKPSYGKPEIG